MSLYASIMVKPSAVHAEETTQHYTAW